MEESKAARAAHKYNDERMRLRIYGECSFASFVSRTLVLKLRTCFVYRVSVERTCAVCCMNILCELQKRKKIGRLTIYSRLSCRGLYRRTEPKQRKLFFFCLAFCRAIYCRFSASICGSQTYNGQIYISPHRAHIQEHINKRRRKKNVNLPDGGGGGVDIYNKVKIHDKNKRIRRTKISEENQKVYVCRQHDPIRQTKKSKGSESFSLIFSLWLAYVQRTQKYIYISVQQFQIK